MAGRPTAYKREYADRAMDYCLLGATDVDLANFFGVSEQTINAWKHKHPEFLEAIKEGKEEADAKVAKSLYKKALDGDTTSAIFWLKNRRKRDWRDKQEIEHSGEINHITDDQLDARIAQLIGKAGTAAATGGEGEEG